MKRLLLLISMFFMYSSFTFAQSALLKEFSLWKQTEPEMQDELSIAKIKPKLEANELTLWASPIKIVFIDKIGYILNGHHRIKAAVEIKWSGKIPYTLIPVADISKHSGFKTAKEVVAASL